MGFVDARALVRRLRAVKSEAEIAKIHYCCQLVSAGFEALPQALTLGMSERSACKALQLDVLRRGVDSTPYLIGASGPESYDNIIMGPTDRTLEEGDVLVIDTGCTFDGYFCDFDRNFAFGTPSQATETPISFKPNLRLDFTKILIPFGLLIIFFIKPLLKIIPLNILIYVNS